MNLKRVFFLISVPMMIQAADDSSGEQGCLWEHFLHSATECTPEQTNPPKKPKCSFPLEGALQVRAGYFEFASNSVQRIYGNGAPDIELEGSLKVHPHISLWSNLNYVWKGGHSIALTESTHLDLGTLSLGASLIAPFISSFTFIYFGLGISGAYVHTKDKTSYLPQNTTKFGVGGVAKSGILVSCTRHFFLNLFFDYYYQPIHTRSSAIYSQVNLGGFRAGLGAGYNF